MTTERPFKLGGYEGVSRSEPNQSGDPMTTMLEKMAEAMWSVKLATDAVPGVEVPATEPLWLGLPDLERTRWRYRARAALQAIREVDQETYNAGWDAMTGEPDAGPGEPWLAMIDTILAEDKG